MLPGLVEYFLHGRSFCLSQNADTTVIFAQVGILRDCG
jgi:hypothetical protein